MALRIARSGISVSQIIDTRQLVTGITKHLIGSSDETDAPALRFTTLVSHLDDCQVDLNKDRCLKFLYELSRKKRLQCASTDRPGTILQPFQTHVASHNVPKSLGAYGEPTGMNAMEDVQPAFAPGIPGRTIQGFRRYTSSVAEADTIPESLLVQDVFALCTGVDGNLLRLSEEQIVVPKKSVEVPKPSMVCIKLMARTGLVCRDIERFLRSPGDGLVRQSFVSVIRDYLSQFRGSVAVWDSRSRHDPKSVTLKQLYLSLTTHAVKLDLILNLIARIEHLAGSELIRMIHDHQLMHGDSIIQQFVPNILESIREPLLQFVKSWVVDGKLEDPFDEFFIAQYDGATDDTWWCSKYWLRQNQSPGFWRESFVRRIFLCGKTLNFLQTCCGEQIQAPMWDDSTMQDIEELSRTVEKRYHFINAQTLQVLATKFNLAQHLVSLKKYFLLEAGDFIHNLMDLVQPYLQLPADELRTHHLTGALDRALRMTSTGNEDSEFDERLDVAILKPQPSDLGWDVFTLEYRVGSPLDNILHKHALRSYKRIFTVLWQVKRLEFSLSRAWTTRSGASRTRFPELNIVHSSFLLTNSEMLLFIQQYQYCIHHQVLERAWFKELGFHRAFDDFEDLLHRHEEYLKLVLRIDREEVRGTIRKIIGAITSFQAAHERLVELELAEWQRRASLLRRREERTLRGEFGLLGEDGPPDAIPEATMPHFGAVLQQNLKARERFRGGMQELLEVLKDMADTDEGLWASLLLRLNYSGFYSPG